MTDTNEIVTLSLDETDLEPATVYAKLRSYTPGRASFLFESRQHDAPAGRYSIVGYRVRSGEMMPPAVDAIGAQLDGYARHDARPTFAEAMAHASVGFFSHANANSIHGIRHWEDESISGYFLLGATVVVFDHQERSITVAGRKAGRVAERCVWELRNGPEPAPLAAALAGALPVDLRATLDEEQLAARLTRAKRFLGEPVSELALAHSLHAPMRGADPFDVYRALRAASTAPSLYFIDFGSSPVTPPLQLLGVAAEPMVMRRAHADAGAAANELGAELRACFPGRAVVGSEPADAARIVRRLEDTSREFVGAAVGYLGPGAVSCFVLAERAIAARGGSFELACTVPLGPATDPVAAARAARDAVGLELAAIRAAQDAAPVTDAAAPAEPVEPPSS